MAAGERSEFGAAAERSPRPRSARAYSAPIGILGFSGIPFPFQKSHSRAEAGGRPFRARWDFGIFWNHIHIPKSHSVPFNPIQSHARPYGSRREALKQPEGGPSAAWLRCFGASAEALRCFGLGDYAAGGRPISGPHSRAVSAHGARGRQRSRPQQPPPSQAATPLVESWPQAAAAHGGGSTPISYPDGRGLAPWGD